MYSVYIVVATRTPFLLCDSRFDTKHQRSSRHICIIHLLTNRRRIASRAIPYLPPPPRLLIARKKDVACSNRNSGVTVAPYHTLLLSRIRFIPSGVVFATTSSYVVHLRADAQRVFMWYVKTARIDMSSSALRAALVSLAALVLCLWLGVASLHVVAHVWG